MTVNLITNNQLYPPPPCWLLKAPGQIWRSPLTPVQFNDPQFDSILSSGFILSYSHFPFATIASFILKGAGCYTELYKLPPVISQAGQSVRKRNESTLQVILSLIPKPVSFSLERMES